MVVELNPSYITDEAGEKLSVILPVEEYENLLEELEDLISIAQRKDEDITSHKDFIKELEEDGII